MRTRWRRRVVSSVVSGALGLGAIGCGGDETEAVPEPEAAPIASDARVGDGVDAAPPGERGRAEVRAVEEAGGGRVVSVEFDMDDDGRTDDDGDGLTADRWSIVVEEDGDRTLVVLDRNLQVVFMDVV